MAGERRNPKIAKQEELEPWAEEGPMSDRNSQPQTPSYSSGNVLLEADYQPSSLQSGLFPAKGKALLGFVLVLII